MSYFALSINLRKIASKSNVLMRMVMIFMNGDDYYE